MVYTVHCTVNKYESTFEGTKVLSYLGTLVQYTVQYDTFVPSKVLYLLSYEGTSV